MSQGAPCTLCQLPSGRRPVLRDFGGRGDGRVGAQELIFCCMGCANVYSILLESGMIASGQDLRETEIFRRSLELGLVSNPEVAAEAAAADADPNTPSREVLLQVGGMWCSACAWLIEHGVRGLPGVLSCEVFFTSDVAKVRYNPQALPTETIVARIRKLGYRAEEFSGENTAARAEQRDLLQRLGVAGFLYVNIMGFSAILYVGYFQNISASASRVVPLLLWILATPLVFYCAWPILRAALAGARNLQIRMETLLALGILAAYFVSAGQVLAHRTHVYFDTAAAIVTFLLAGKLIERAAKDRASGAVALLYRLMPSKVRLLSAAGERFVTIEALEPGEVFVVKAGERIPADGVVLEGDSYADESLLSGEATPVNKHPGDTVVSGSLNAGSVLKVRATRIGPESTLAQIIRLVESALGSRTELERAVDRVSRIFVPAVVVLTLGVLAVLLARHAGVAYSLMRATTILVIACPCALGLATPLAITAAVGQASARGILVSNSRVLETITRIGAVVLDKTGTVTQGDFRLLEFSLAPAAAAGVADGASVDAAEGVADDAAESEAVRFHGEWLPLLAGVESYSEHLLGRAVLQYAGEQKAAASEASEVAIHKGAGITGRAAGRRLFLGNQLMVQQVGAELPPPLAERAAAWQEAGYTVVFFGGEGTAGWTTQGALAFGDRIKSGAAEMVAHLRQRGIQVSLLSGDSWATTGVVARQIGVESFTAEATPESKARAIAALQQKGLQVAVIGDGVNDAPALAQADLGIALGTGADIAMSAAPVVLVSGSLAKVEEAFELAHGASRIIRQNLFWAFIYNVAGISLAVTGVLTPIMAAGAMLCSSASVVGNSMRLMRAQEKTVPAG
jgi:heavy metal translocating P-type ATPase